MAMQRSMKYQYETSPRKYEPEYTTRRKTTTKRTQAPKKTTQKKPTAKVKKAEENKSKFKQVVVVMVVFGMLLALSYREISIMEMFNQKKDLEQH